MHLPRRRQTTLTESTKWRSNLEIRYEPEIIRSRMVKTVSIDMAPSMADSTKVKLRISIISSSI